ncbi:MAG: PqqD family protein [Thermoplasmata archaeon]
MKKLGGSPEIRRRLDRPGSDIWFLCDGRHTVAEICDEMDKKYREELEPVLTRVTKFLEMLLARNLIYLRKEKVEGGEIKGASGPEGAEGWGSEKARGPETG